MSAPNESKAGRYVLVNWLFRGGRRHAPGEVVDLSHEDAALAIDGGTAKPLHRADTVVAPEPVPKEPASPPIVDAPPSPPPATSAPQNPQQQQRRK